MIKGRFGSKTDIGLVRRSNEDKALSIIDSDGNVLLCVCDGMGGSKSGEYASKIAVDVLSSGFNDKKPWNHIFQVKRWLRKMVKSINYSIYHEAKDEDNYSGMGTTLVAAVFFKDYIFTVNIGDSRCYILEKDRVIQVTRDQTYAEYLVANKKLSEDKKNTSKNRHALMNFLGKNKSANFELRMLKNPGKTVLLCSDGLYNNASNKQIYSALNSGERLDQKISTLIGIAKANGGTDNIAISIWEPNEND